MARNLISSAGTALVGGVPVYVDGASLDLDASLAVFNHSPDGFGWGYGGSGPSQLALAILLRFTDAVTAVRYHQAFKWAYVARWPQGQPVMAEVDVELWLRQQGADAAVEEVVAWGGQEITWANASQATKESFALVRLYWYFRMIRSGGPDGSDLDNEVEQQAREAAEWFGPLLEARAKAAGR